MRYSIKDLLVVLTMAGLVFAVWLLLKCQYLGVEALGISFHEANSILMPDYKIPEASQNISLFKDAYCCEIQFEISERDFLDWCQENNWRYIKVSSFDFGFTLLNAQDIHSSGYEFYPYGGDGVFDSKRSVVCFVVSEFP